MPIAPWRGDRRRPARVDVAKAAIAGDHFRLALRDRLVLAIPHHVAGAEILYRAPRRVADGTGLARRHANQHGRRQAEGRKQELCHRSHGQRSDGQRSDGAEVGRRRRKGKGGRELHQRANFIQGWTQPGRASRPSTTRRPH